MALSKRFRKVMRVVTDVLVGQGEVISGESSDDPDQPPDSSTVLISKGIEFTPTADTRFSKDTILYAYFEVNDPRLAGQSGLTIQVDLRILDAKSGRVKVVFQPVDAAPYIKEDSSLIRIGREIPLAGLPSGAYRLEVQATDSAGKSTARRTASFTIDDFSYDKLRSPVVGAHRSQECFSLGAEWVCR